MLWIHCRSAPLLSLALSTKVSHQSTLPLNVIRLPFRWAILLIHLCMSSCQTKRPRGQKKGWSALLQLRQCPPPLSIRNWRGSRPYPDVSCDYIKRSDFSRDNRQPCSSDKHSSSDNRTWQHCWYNSNVVLQCADVCVRQNRLISTFVLSSASCGGRCVHSIGVRKIKKSRSATMNANQKGKKISAGLFWSSLASRDLCSQSALSLSEWAVVLQRCLLNRRYLPFVDEFTLSTKATTTSPGRQTCLPSRLK